MTCAPRSRPPRELFDEHARDRPKSSLHHINLKTSRLQELIDWYGVVVGATVTFQGAAGAWLTNDAANHRIALLTAPDFIDDPERETRVGMHHSAFEYDCFDDLNASYQRMRDAGIEPDFCLDHGVTLSYYYKDPEGNRVELQVDNFGDWAKSIEWMQTSPAFAANPLGVFVDPAKIATAAGGGASFDEIHARAMSGDFAPDPLEV